MMLLDLLGRGGWMMWVILGISIIALAITLERVIMIYIRARLNVGAFMVRIKGLVENRKYAEAIESCNVRSQHPLPSVLKAGIAT